MSLEQLTIEDMQGATMQSESQDITAAYSHNDQFSYQANKSLKDKNRLRTMVLAYITANPPGVTCDEAEQYLEMSHQSCSARFSELKAMDLIEQTGKKPTRSGRMAGCWRAK